MSEDEIRLLAQKKTVLVEMTYKRIAVLVVSLLLAAFGFAQWIAPIVSDRHNDQRYVRLQIYDAGVARLEKKIEDQRSERQQQLAEIKAKLDRIEERQVNDTKEILRFLRR